MELTRSPRDVFTAPRPAFLPGSLSPRFNSEALPIGDLFTITEPPRISYMEPDVMIPETVTTYRAMACPNRSPFPRFF